jgi:hypothetical protein
LKHFYQEVRFTVAVKMGENKESNMYRLRRGDAFVCKCGTSFKVEAWASEIRLLVYFIGPPNQGHLSLYSTGFIFNVHAMTIPYPDAVSEIKVDERIDLVWSCADIPAVLDSGEFSRLFTCSASTFCTSRYR